MCSFVGDNFAETHSDRDDKHRCEPVAAAINKHTQNSGQREIDACGSGAVHDNSDQIEETWRVEDTRKTFEVRRFDENYRE